LSMAWTESIVQERVPVWDVLSEFWLDGDLVETDYERIAATLKASPYTKEQLLKICIYEVAPAVSSNLISIAGEWGAFDPEWLKQAIMKKSPNPDDYLTPGIWKQIRGIVHISLVKSSGWKEITKRL